MVPFVKYNHLGYILSLFQYFFPVRNAFKLYLCILASNNFPRIRTSKVTPFSTVHCSWIRWVLTSVPFASTPTFWGKLILGRNVVKIIEVTLSSFCLSLSQSGCSNSRNHLLMSQELTSTCNIDVGVKTIKL